MGTIRRPEDEEEHLPPDDEEEEEKAPEPTGPPLPDAGGAAGD